MAVKYTSLIEQQWAYYEYLARITVPVVIKRGNAVTSQHNFIARHMVYEGHQSRAQKGVTIYWQPPPLAGARVDHSTGQVNMDTSPLLCEGAYKHYK